MRQITFLNQWLDNVSGVRVESLGTCGGLSGAVFWRVLLPERVYCLRRWPKEHPTAHGLTAIHGLLQHVAQAGFHVAPVPLRTKTGKTFFVHQGRLWELAPWMRGEASYREQPRPARLQASMHALARLHKAARSYQPRGIPAPMGISPGLQRRLQRLRCLQHGELDELRQAARTAKASRLREVAFDLLAGIERSLERVTQNLEPIVETRLPLQWCLRDVRHDHILFQQDRVSGLIDFGAAAVDSVAGDLARLLGSMVDDDSDRWQAGVDAYGQLRPLAASERRAIARFDTSGVLGSAANWVHWLFVQRRRFPQIEAVQNRMLWLRQRLCVLARRNGASVFESSSKGVQ